MQLFYNPEISASIKQFIFNKTESQHIVRVLRKKEGDTIFITNGLGELFTSIIVIANTKKCLVEITNVESKIKPWKYYLHIAIAPTKSNERFEIYPCALALFFTFVGVCWYRSLCRLQCG